MHSGAIWRMQLNDPWAAAMWPCVESRWPSVYLATCTVLYRLRMRCSVPRVGCVIRSRSSYLIKHDTTDNMILCGVIRVLLYLAGVTAQTCDGQTDGRADGHTTTQTLTSPAWANRWSIFNDVKTWRKVSQLAQTNPHEAPCPTHRVLYKDCRSVCWTGLKTTLLRIASNA